MSIDITQIKTMPNYSLTVPSMRVSKFSMKLNNLVSSMYLNMYRDGIGLAAPQIGVNLSCIILNTNLTKDNKETQEQFRPSHLYVRINNENKECYALFNAKILTYCDTKILDKGEGCLSVPCYENINFLGHVTRYKKITITYQDIIGNQHQVNLDGLPAIVIQHELDHLNGILFVHRMKHQDNKKLDTLLAKYSAIYSRHRQIKAENFKAAIEQFMEYGMQNILNQNTYTNIEDIHKFGEERNMDKNIISEICNNIQYFESDDV